MINILMHIGAFFKIIYLLCRYGHDATVKMLNKQLYEARMEKRRLEAEHARGTLKGVPRR
jgi:hypothetical protein